MFFLYFLKFNFRSSKAEIGVKLIPPTKLAKKSSVQRFIFSSLSPNWSFPQLALFVIFLCY